MPTFINWLWYLRSTKKIIFHSIQGGKYPALCVDFYPYCYKLLLIFIHHKSKLRCPLRVRHFIDSRHMVHKITLSHAYDKVSANTASSVRKTYEFQSGHRVVKWFLRPSYGRPKLTLISRFGAMQIRCYEKLTLIYFSSNRFETNRTWAPILGLHVLFVSKRSDQKYKSLNFL